MIEKWGLKNSTVKVTEERDIITIRTVAKTIIIENPKETKSENNPEPLESTNDDEDNRIEKIMRNGIEDKDYWIH